MDIENKDENYIIAKAKDGDKSAFMELVSIYKPRILGTVSRFGRNSEEVRDLAQDVFMEVWRALPGYRYSAPFEHWISRVTHNLCLRYLRKHFYRRSLEVIGLYTKQDRRLITVEPIDEKATRARSHSEAREILSQALMRLSPKDALVITMKEVEGHSIADIARDTGWSESSVKVRNHRARRKLRVVLEEMGFDPSNLE